MRVGFLHFIGQHRVDHYLACRFYYAYCQIQLLFHLLMDCIYSADCMTRKVCIWRNNMLLNILHDMPCWLRPSPQIQRRHRTLSKYTSPLACQVCHDIYHRYKFSLFCVAMVVKMLVFAVFQGPSLQNSRILCSDAFGTQIVMWGCMSWWVW